MSQAEDWTFASYLELVARLEALSFENANDAEKEGKYFDSKLSLAKKLRTLR